MPVKIVKGNLLDAEETIIAHQVNCRGAFGAGIAGQLRKKWPSVYDQYLKFYTFRNKDPKNLLGDICVAKIKEERLEKIVCHLFGQDEYGNDRNRVYTNYHALRRCFERLERFGRRNGVDIALPYNIGCGLGGGDWDNEVLPMILDIFGESSVNVTIYQL